MSADEGRDFDWAAVDVVVPEQAAISVYTNPAGDVVVRQCGAWSDENDASIWFGPEHARAIAFAILHVAGYETTAPAPKPTQGAIKAKDSTGAERQKRRRARQKEPTIDIDRDQDRDADRDVTAANRDSSRAGRVTETVTRHGEEG